MASHHDDLVRPLLRPSETLRCTLYVELAAEGTLTDRADPTDNPFQARQRLIAVVAHRNYSQDAEVGSLFVLDAHATNGVPRAVDVLPITEHLVLTVAQTRQLDPSTAESDTGVSTEKQSAWLLSFSPDAQDTRPLEFVVRARNTQQLRNLATECRRLKMIAASTHPVSTDFAWIEAYVAHQPSRRLDLRLRKQPLHTRLSSATAGFSSDDVSDVSIIRRDWIERAASREASSSSAKHLKIRLGTFNVNGKPPSQDLYPWLRGFEPGCRLNTGWISPLKLSPLEVSSDQLHRELQVNNSETADSQSFWDPDVLVLGFQELDLSTEALLYATSTLKEDEWLTAIFAGLGEKRILYEKLTSKQLVGMLLIVIVKKVLAPCFTDVRSSEAGSGIMGFMGNKGATAIRLEFTPKMPESSDPPSTTYRSTVLTFVNAHLAASDEMVERRNYDFQELNSRLTFNVNDLNRSYVPTSFAEDTYNIYESDVLFWMVHLNYRLDLSDGDTLLSYDQLRAAMSSKTAFSDFTEHPITHFPTYRLALGVSKDQLGYDVKRKPAWTDRVLYMASPDVGVVQAAYRSHPEITMSDHQPVSADFDISLALIDLSQYKHAALALHRELAGFEGSNRRPKIKIQPISIDLGAVKYKQSTHREVVIQNEGDIPCVFRFVGARTDSEPVAPSWLRIEPMAGLLRPGGTTIILLSAHVDNDSAAKLNLGPSTLECTLILHTALGKDDFIAVSGNYQYTCFANTLERLTRLAVPIRKLKSPEEVLPAGQATNAPTEMMRLINWMMMHVSTIGIQNALFEAPVEEHLCHVVRECLDTGDEFPSEGPDGTHRALVVAFFGTLVAFLDSLVEPVVPPRLHAQCLQARDKDEAFEVLNAFPHESINVWISLTACLHYIAQRGQSKDDSISIQTSPSRAERLASIFAPVLLRDDPTGVHPRASPVGKCEFLLRFID